MIHENVLIVCEEGKYAELYQMMFSEILGDKVIFLDKVFQKKLTWFQKIIFANKIYGITRFFLPYLYWRKFQIISWMEKLTQNRSEPVYLMFLSPSVQKYYTKEFLKRLKKQYKQVKIGLLFVDSAFVQQASNALKLSLNEEIFDVVYSFDEKDAQNYGFTYADTPYSEYKGNKDLKEYDLYFCGSVKGRAELLKEIHDRLKNKVTCVWDIFSNKSTKQKEIELIQTFTRCRESTEVLPYSEVLKKTMKANCILDIVQKGQKGKTVRYYEAICNNKKLLTNNETVLTSKYYNPQYIQYFSKVEDINMEWIKEPCEVNFGYQGEFSPENLIHRFVSECRS